MIFASQKSIQIAVMIPMFITWGFITILALYLIASKKFKKKLSIVLYVISLGIGGFLLGGIPNAILPIQTILSYFNTLGPFIQILPMVIILGILLLTTLFFGRIFCGFACPLGGLQELISKIQFRSSPKENNRFRYKIKIPQLISNGIRISFFIIIAIFTIIWGINLIQIINPFLGFQLFRAPSLLAIMIPIFFLGSISVGSIFTYRPWCRLFCPFGMVSNITSRFSKYNLERTEDCTDCGLCEEVCPTESAQKEPQNGGCYYCERCIDVCPQEAMEFKN